MESRGNNLPLYKRLAAARRTLGMAQSALAREAGCAQAAISMMENGKPDAIARDTIVKIAKILNVEIDDADDKVQIPPARPTFGLSFCPNPECPSNVPYAIGDGVAIWPTRQPGGGDARYCAFCGEVLEHACPNCGAALSEGAFCPQCGAPRVSPPVDGQAELAGWIERRRREIAALAPFLK